MKKCKVCNGTGQVYKEGFYTCEKCNPENTVYQLKEQNEQLQAENKKLKERSEQLEEALRANIKYCEYYDGQKRCEKIASWGIFDWEGWEEYFCDEHKIHKISREKATKLENNILAEQALKGGEK